MAQEKNLQRQNIAIIGAGIMGLNAAYTLQTAGHIITLFDQAPFPAQNASWMAGAMLAPYSEIEHMNQSWIEACQTSINIWQQTNKTLGGRAKLKTNGSLLISHTEDLHSLTRFSAHVGHYDDCKIIDTKAIQSLEPLLEQRFPHGIFLRNEGHLCPEKTMSALHDFLINQGTILKTQKIEPEKLSDSQSFDWVIDCRGYEARKNDKNLRGVKGEYLLVENHEFQIQRPLRLMHPRYALYIVPRENHHFMIGATSIESAENTQISLRSSMELMSALYSLHPSFAEARIIKLAAGIRPAYPDNLPRIQMHKNVISCNGLYRHGFLLSPVMATCVRDIITRTDNQFTSLFMRNNNEDHHQRGRNNLESAA